MNKVKIIVNLQSRAQYIEFVGMRMAIPRETLLSHFKFYIPSRVRPYSPMMHYFSNVLSTKPKLTFTFSDVAELQDFQLRMEPSLKNLQVYCPDRLAATTSVLTGITSLRRHIAAILGKNSIIDRNTCDLEPHPESIFQVEVAKSNVTPTPDLTFSYEVTRPQQYKIDITCTSIAELQALQLRLLNTRGDLNLTSLFEPINKRIDKTLKHYSLWSNPTHNSSQERFKPFGRVQLTITALNTIESDIIVDLLRVPATDLKEAYPYSFKTPYCLLKDRVPDTLFAISALSEDPEEVLSKQYAANDILM